jgi:hypothetical protein
MPRGSALSRSEKIRRKALFSGREEATQKTKDKSKERMQKMKALAKRAFIDGYLEVLKQANLLGQGDVGRSGSERDASQMHNQNSDVPIAKEQQPGQGYAPHQTPIGQPQNMMSMPSPPPTAAFAPAGNKQTGKPQLGYKEGVK